MQQEAAARLQGKPWLSKAFLVSITLALDLRFWESLLFPCSGWVYLSRSLSDFADSPESDGLSAVHLAKKEAPDQELAGKGTARPSKEGEHGNCGLDMVFGTSFLKPCPRFFFEKCIRHEC